MSGYREFRPGQIWFYYNPNVSKELERKKELGAITSRPVVIVQNAYYPEWTDSVTVIPMTSSDRRSGIHIDTTILHDGSILEGGTVLPYLFYTVKTRYLHAMTSDPKGERLQLVSLSDEDYELVQQAIAYHLGLSKEVPQYVKNWKTLKDYDRSAIIKQIRLVVNDFENQQRRVVELMQAVDPSPVCENHVNACFNRVSADRTQFLTSTGDVAPREDVPQGPTLKPSSLTVSEAKEYKKNHTQPSILFQPVSLDKWAETMDSYMIFQDDDVVESRIYPGSRVLATVPYNQIHTVLSQQELDTVAAMGTTEVMENTGAPSKGTAYRIRKWAADNQSIADIVEEKVPEIFHYDSRGVAIRTSIRTRNKRLKRYRILFSLSENECIFVLKSPIEELVQHFPSLASSEIKQLKVDIVTMYPNRTVTISDNGKYKARYAELTKALAEDAAQAIDAEFNTYYELWETLCPSEISEIASASKRNAINVAKKYGVPKSNFPALRSVAIEISRANGKVKQPPIDEDRKQLACQKIITEDLTTISSTDILIFCRTDYAQIVALYGKCGSPNTPSKKDIVDLKRNLRHIIVRKKVPK